MVRSCLHSRAAGFDLVCASLSSGADRWQLNLRFEERLAERTRIAQELHDTLLQGIAGASMYLHMAADSLPAGSTLNEPLTKALDNRHWFSTRAAMRFRVFA